MLDIMNVRPSFEGEAGKMLRKPYFDLALDQQRELLALAWRMARAILQDPEVSFRRDATSVVSLVGGSMDNAGEVMAAAADVTGPDPGRDRSPRGGGGGSADPKIVNWNNVLCRCRRRHRFCFRHMAEGKFFVRPYVSVLKIFRISCRIQKWVKSTKKDFDPDPASRSDLG